MKELRIGLVLYGGVSLAVYMNGVVTEIWHALRASVARDRRRLQVEGTAEVYRRLIEDLKKSHGGADLRIVVDTITGTSAGGVNGLVLGKAIATGANAAVLNNTWIERAGIEDLAAAPYERLPWPLRFCDHVIAAFWSKFRNIRRTLNRTPGIDWAWARDHMYSVFRRDHPANQTPLRGDYFTEMIATTLATMEKCGPKLLPPGGRLDLILTRTDLYGWPRHLPVDPCLHKVLLESAHAHRMRFRYHRSPLASTPGLIDDFGDDFSLTYAARTTAGFPLAFAPVDYSNVRESFRQVRPNDTTPTGEEFAARHLPEHRLAGYRVDTAWMVDGGILDNKPFSSAIALIEEKPANRDVHRTLMYIEPDPSLVDHVDRVQRPVPKKMPALLYKLFRHEPILADLQAVAARNRRVKRLIVIADTAERDGASFMDWNAVGRHLDRNDLERSRQRANDLLRSVGNPAYSGYTTIKAKRAADTLAHFLSDALGYPRESKHGYFVREIVRGFLDRRGAFDPPTLEENQVYQSNVSQLALLKAFDVPYRLRRLRNMVRIVNEQYAQDVVDGSVLDRFKSALMQSIFAFDRLFLVVREQNDPIRKSFQEMFDTDDLDACIRSYAGDPFKIGNVGSPRFDQLYMQLQKQFQATMEERGTELRTSIAELQGTLHERIARAYVVYPMIDAAIFPQMDSWGIGDLSITQVLRISPHDARALSVDPRRLKGRETGAFAGFLRKKARRHDLLWGRLDGAERLIDLIITAAIGSNWSDGVKELRADTLTNVVRAILKESLVSADRPLKRLIRDIQNGLQIQP